MDVFDCLFEGLPKGLVDLSARKRNELVEVNTVEGIRYFETIISKLQQLKGADLDQLILVKDDLGLGFVEQHYTLGGLLIMLYIILQV